MYGKREKPFYLTPNLKLKVITQILKCGSLVQLNSSTTVGVEIKISTETLIDMYDKHAFQEYPKIANQIACFTKAIILIQGYVSVPIFGTFTHLLITGPK